jgi:hypothetical protein
MPGRKGAAGSIHRWAPSSRCKEGASLAEGLTARNRRASIPAPTLVGMAAPWMYQCGRPGSRGALRNEECDMTKLEAEKGIRKLCPQWAQEICISMWPEEQPSYLAFKLWCQAKGYGHYFKFRSDIGPDKDAERWFDQEFHQT